MRIAWRTVGWICERVAAEAQAQRDLFADSSASGIDEISVRKGQRYLTVVVDHDTGRLVWAHPAATSKTVEKFLDLLGDERCEQIQLVSCDMADWITMPDRRALPERRDLPGPVPRVKLATDALDEVRREVWNDTRKAGQPGLASELKGARFALWKNPERLTERHQPKLARIQQINKRPLPRLPDLPAAARDLPRPVRAGARAARRMAEVGPPLPARAVRQARQDDHQAASRDRGGPSAPPVERQDRASEHPDPADHPPRFRLPLTLGRDRPRDALTRRALPTTPQPVTPPTVPAGGSQIVQGPI